MDFVSTILNLDRRIIYLIVALLVAIPLIKPFHLPIIPTREVHGIYDQINALEPGSHVLISADFDPASKPELLPMLEAVLAHCFSRDLKVHLLTLWPSGPGLAQQAIEGQGEIYGKESGKDWCFLGYRAGALAVILGMASSIPDTFATDFYGKSTSAMPIYQEVSRIKQMSYLMELAAGPTVETWIAYASQPQGVPMGASCTAVSAAGYYPYLQAGQITGLAGGMKGTAEYEVLLRQEYDNHPCAIPLGDATIGMDAQSAIHVFIVLSIIVANICYFIAAKREREARRAK